MRYIKTGLVLVLLLAQLTVAGQPKTLSLNEALALAKEHNRALKSRRLQLQSAQLQTDVAKGSMMPSISAFGNYSYYFDRQVIFMPGAFGGNETEPVIDVSVGGKNAFNTYVSFSQPLLSEAARRQIAVSRLNESIEELNVRDYSGDLTMQVTIAYYQALFIEQSVRLNGQSLERNLHALQNSRSLLLQGKSLKVDTLRNYIAVEHVKATIAELKHQHAIVHLQLRQLLGISDDEGLLLTDSLLLQREERYFSAVDPSNSGAIENRPDFQLKQLQLKLAQNELSRTRAERLPVVSFVAAYQLQAQADKKALDEYRWPATSFIGLQANIPLYSGNRISSRIRQSHVLLQKSKVDLEDTREKARVEIETFERNLRQTLQRLEIQEGTVEAAEVNYRIINDRYRNGLSSRLELSDAELSLTQAKLDQLHSLFRVKVAKLQLDKALGRL